MFSFYEDVPKKCFKIDKKVRHYGKMPRKMKKKYKSFYYKNSYFEIDSFYSCSYFFGSSNNKAYEKAKEIFDKE
jgi:hypothetical protein